MDVLSKLVPGEDAKLQIVRSDGKSEVTIKPKLRQRTSCKLRRAETPSELQKRVLDGWLGKTRDY